MLGCVTVPLSDGFARQQPTEPVLIEDRHAELLFELADDEEAPVTRDRTGRFDDRIGEGAAMVGDGKDIVRIGERLLAQAFECRPAR